MPGSWLPSSGGEGEMPAVCLNIYHILVLVRSGERKVYREGTLFNVFTVFPLGVCVTASQGRPLDCPSPRPGDKPPGAHTATWWWPNPPAPLLSPIFHPMEPRPWRDHPTSAHFQRPKGCGGRRETEWFQNFPTYLGAGAQGAPRPSRTELSPITG